MFPLPEHIKPAPIRDYLVARLNSAGFKKVSCSVLPADHTSLYLEGSTVVVYPGGSIHVQIMGFFSSNSRRTELGVEEFKIDTQPESYPSFKAFLAYWGKRFSKGEGSFPADVWTITRGPDAQALLDRYDRFATDHGYPPLFLAKEGTRIDKPNN